MPSYRNARKMRNYNFSQHYLHTKSEIRQEGLIDGCADKGGSNGLGEGSEEGWVKKLHVVCERLLFHEPFDKFICEAKVKIGNKTYTIAEGKEIIFTGPINLMEVRIISSDEWGRVHWWAYETKPPKASPKVKVQRVSWRNPGR